MRDDLCGAPGPDGVECEGVAGHLGHHGYDGVADMGVRWNDTDAERYAAEAEGLREAIESVQQGQGFPGTVHDKHAHSWQGVCSMGEVGVRVELSKAFMVSAVWLPYTSVARIEWARD